MCQQILGARGYAKMNRLYFGDNLAWLRDRAEFPNESADLVYLDPPFNSNAITTFSSAKPAARSAKPSSTPSGRK